MRIKRFDMSVELLKAILGPGRKCIEATKNALPADAELVRIHVDPFDSSARRLSLFFVSTSYPEIPEGTALENERIEFTQYFDPGPDDSRLTVFS